MLPSSGRQSHRICAPYPSDQCTIEKKVGRKREATRRRPLHDRPSLRLPSRRVERRGVLIGEVTVEVDVVDIVALIQLVPVRVHARHDVDLHVACELLRPMLAVHAKQRKVVIDVCGIAVARVIDDLHDVKVDGRPHGVRERSATDVDRRRRLVRGAVRSRHEPLVADQRPRAPALRLAVRTGRAEGEKAQKRVLVHILHILAVDDAF